MTTKNNDATITPEVLALAKELLAQGKSVSRIRSEMRNATYRDAYHAARQAGLRAEHNALRDGATAEQAMATGERVKREQMAKRLGR